MADAKAMITPGGLFAPVQQVASGIAGIAETPNGKRIILRLEHAAGGTLVPLDAVHARALGEQLIKAADQAETPLAIVREMPNIPPPNGHRG